MLLGDKTSLAVVEAIGKVSCYAIIISEASF